jgi:hypothetical protein
MTGWEIFVAGSDLCRKALPFLSAVLAGLTAFVERDKFWVRVWNSISAIGLVALGFHLLLR